MPRRSGFNFETMLEFGEDDEGGREVDEDDEDENAAEVAPL